MNYTRSVAMKMSERSWSCDQALLVSQPSRNSNVRFHRNVYSLIAQREVSPRTKHVPKRNWAKAFRRKSSSSSTPRNEGPKDARQGLLSWVEAESLRHLSAIYCPLFPPPRSTIAAAFSLDGKVLASTHGDHTVKLIDCATGNCLKVLVGHRRTPWVVRFHPVHKEILASGSLDQEVRLWNANTSECLLSHQFYRSIASIAFHARGEILAVASGHKLYIWHYNKRGEGSSPTFVLKTRRSLRAVHFHPLAAPFLLTAEVNDLDSSDPSMAQATSLGSFQYPPPAIFVTNIRSSEHSTSNDLPLTSFPFFIMPYSIDDLRTQPPFSATDGLSSMQVESSTSTQFEREQNVMERSGVSLTAMEAHSEIPTDSQIGNTANTSFSGRMGNSTSNIPVDNMVIDEALPSEGIQLGNSTTIDIPGAALHGLARHISGSENSTDFGQFVPSRDNVGWELPFLQGWLMGQSQAGAQSMLPNVAGSGDNLTEPVSSSAMASNMYNHNTEAAIGSSVGISGPGGSARYGLQSHLRNSHVSAFEPRHLAALNSHDGSDIQAIVSRFQPELAASVAAAAAPELPCTVKLRLWKYEINNPCAQLVADKCRLTIPHAVLCSEMGAHFSPCGKYLAACVACMFSHVENDPGIHLSVLQDSGAATSPTRHPVSAHQVMYELRIYSLEEATFGSVLASRAIRAAHCLTSIQFSPTSEYILLAYGRRHGSLLKSIVIDGETIQPIYTVLEVYRVSDMELVRVLPSAEDEVNVACFHPFAGGGLVYGTKEGKLRVLQCDRGHGNWGPSHLPEETFVTSTSE